MDKYTARRGKFAVPGYPQKLGFLLYGPPGTSKTSFIKALVHHSNRHIDITIVLVPLSEITTNEELMGIMLDQCASLAMAGDPGEAAPMSLPFKRVIFVMEDVYAASGVVLRRGGEAAAASASASADAGQANTRGSSTAPRAGAQVSDILSQTELADSADGSATSGKPHRAAYLNLTVELNKDSAVCNDEGRGFELEVVPRSWRSLL